MVLSKEKVNNLVEQSNYISRDLSWLQFNYRVLAQVKDEQRTLFDRLRFMSITASNLDEFFMIRVGSLYNYLDFNKERLDYSELREEPFKAKLFDELKRFVTEQNEYFVDKLMPLFNDNGFRILFDLAELNEKERAEVDTYFMNTVFPMLTPIGMDTNHPFPVMVSKLLIFGVVTNVQDGHKEVKKTTFIQIPQNLPRFFEIHRDDEMLFVPIEEIVRANLEKFFRNVKIDSASLFRITRNGDFTIEESDDMETDFIEEMRRKIKTRKTGRVVRVEVQPGYSEWLMERLKIRWHLEQDNVFEIYNLLDLTGLMQIVSNKEFKHRRRPSRSTVPSLTLSQNVGENIFQKIKRNDILLHYPYNSAEPMLNLIETAAEDPDVLAIKMTIYRLAKESRITTALKKAAENGKYVSVLFEIKARFDEENNIKEALKLQEAGCFVIFGTNALKTHAKALMIVRKEGNAVTRYMHLSSGNYNEETAKFYTDVSLLTASETYAQDVAEFFNAITGYSRPDNYRVLLTAPHDLRNRLIELVENEAENALKRLPNGIVIKINSLQDKKFIDALYRASQAGVKIKLIVRGICCLRPGRPGLSENIEVRSIVGDFLEHSRILYFHNAGEPKVYAGSADAMVRSFDRRIETLFQINDQRCKQEAINILAYNLKDNVNAFEMREDGNYQQVNNANDAIFNVHEEFYKVTPDIIRRARLF